MHVSKMAARRRCGFASPFFDVGEGEDETTAALCVDPTTREVTADM